jgi:LAO/AO transport system kinase
MRRDEDQHNALALQLLEAAIGGDRRSLAKLLSLIEASDGGAHSVARALAGKSKHRPIVGITGAPGAGKSSLTDHLIARFRSQQQSVAVLCVDPTSPFSGGAILGDRVRMQQHVGDEGVFIRSMATRGHLGGLAVATPLALRAFDAVGFGQLIVETVGVGQVEVAVAGAADTTVVVVNPGWGDGVQANKAGLLEVADIFVINKSDRPGVDETRLDLELMLDLAATTSHENQWRPPIVLTTATSGTGIVELHDAIVAHTAWLAQSGVGQQRRAERVDAELDAAVRGEIQRLVMDINGTDVYTTQRQLVRDDQIDAWTAAQTIIASLVNP